MTDNHEIKEETLIIKEEEFDDLDYMQPEVNENNKEEQFVENEVQLAKKQHRNRYSFEEKAKILEEAKYAFPQVICAKYGINERTLRQWKRKREEIETTSKKSICKNLKKHSNTERLDDEVFSFLLDAQKKGIHVTGSIIQQKAKKINKMIGGSANFRASEGWLSKWKSRKGIRTLNEPGQNVHEDMSGSLSSSENADNDDFLESSKDEATDDEIMESMDSSEAADNDNVIKPPKVTPEILDFFENLVAWMRTQVQPSGSSSTNEKTFGAPGYLQKCSKPLNSPPSGYSRLSLSENVFVKDSVLLEVSQFVYNPEKIVRRLLLELVGRKKLINMSALGKKGNQAIPQEILNAVYSYTCEKNQGPSFTFNRFVKTINYQCTTLRHPRTKKS